MSKYVGEDEEPIESCTVVHQDDGAVLTPHRLPSDDHPHPTQLLHQKLKTHHLNHISMSILVNKP